MSSPSPARSDRRPRSPFIRGSIRSATAQRSQITEPSSRANATTPRAVREVAAVGSADSTRLDPTQSSNEEEDGRAEQDHEHRRENQEHKREQDFDRRFLGLFLCNGVAPPTHLVSQVTHDLPDRDTEPLALHDRADERSHRRGVAAGKHVQQRLLDREPHALLLERQTHGGSGLHADARCEPDPNHWESDGAHDAVAGKPARGDVIEACRDEIPSRSRLGPTLRATADGGAELRRDLVELASNTIGRLILLLAPREAVRLHLLRHARRRLTHTGPDGHTEKRADGKAGHEDSDDEQQDHLQTLMFTIRLITSDPPTQEMPARTSSTRPTTESYMTFM